MGSASAAAAGVEEARHALRADGAATVLAIGTANPATCISQDAFPDYYFGVTKSDHHTDLKAKLTRLCKQQQLIMHLKPCIYVYFLYAAIPLLGLRPSVRRTMLYLNACYAGAAALRLAKDMAENNRCARVLVVCAELAVVLFDKPEEGQFINTLVNQAFFSDGAGAVIIGADPVSPIERPLFELVSAAQAIIPGTEDAISMLLTKDGLGLTSTSSQLGEFIGANIQQCLLDAFSPLGINRPEWNDLFWVLHPGNPGILNRITEVLQLKPGKLAASKHVLSEFGNMFGATVLFVLDEMRKRMATGPQPQEEELQWGVLMGFGPGMTAETMVLRVPRNE